MGGISFNDDYLEGGRVEHSRSLRPGRSPTDHYKRFSTSQVGRYLRAGLFYATEPYRLLTHTYPFPLLFFAITCSKVYYSLRLVVHDRS